MRSLRKFSGLLVLSLLLTVPARFAAAAEVVVLPLKGAVNPAMVELVQVTLTEADRGQAGLVVLEIDTPGGLLSSTREIVEAILKSRVPVAAYVAPAGAQCASAGTFIALACPVLAMAPGTSIGAAHPVSPFGRMDETMEKKAVNDAAAWIASLAGRWDRNRAWAESAVRESAALEESGALQQDVIDLIAADRNELLVRIDGRKVKLDDRETVIRTTGAPVREIKPNLRQRILQSVSDPTVVYVLLLLGILGLLAEFSTPGIGFPGIVGSICLFLAFYGISVLPINIAGLALIFVAAGFFILEAYTPSFGVLGIGGIVALIFGSLLLVKPLSYLRVSYTAYFIGGLVFSGLVLLIASFAFRVHRKQVTTGKEGLVDEIGEARTDLDPKGTIYVHGEYWTALSESGPVRKGEPVRVVGMEGHILRVVKREEPPSDPA